MADFQPKRKRIPKEILERREFEGHISLVTYQNEDGSFKVVTFRDAGGVEFKSTGYLYGAGAGVFMRIKGEWKDHPKYGWTFQVESWQPHEPVTNEGLLAYLGSGLIKGIGKKTAERIVDHFGESTLETLDNAPELLEHVPKIGRKSARKIAEQWEQHRAERETMLFLKKYGLSNAISLRLLRHYGDNAAAVLQTNPYRVGLEVRHIGFVKADEIAERMGIARDDPMRIQGAFVHLLDKAAGEGHTYLPREELVSRACEMLDLSRELVEDVLGQAVSNDYIKREELESGESYFMPSLHACESGASREITNLNRSAAALLSGDIQELIDDFEVRYRFRLAPQQQDAIRAAAAGGVCVITGGPGTGKTTLVRALLHVIAKKVDFALCSPTGRAAQRLSETTGQTAATVHRLLKWNAQTSRFTHNSENPLPLKLLIVDEASMLDIPLAYSLLRAIKPGATVVFVGDVDQLPSVGAGTFLRDLIESGRTKVTRLEVIFRQKHASWIVQNSHRINEGRSLIYPPADDHSADFFFIDREEPEAIRETALTMALDRIPKKLGCDRVDDIQLLSPMRRGPLGTFELNEMMQQRINPDGARIGRHGALRTGDKVIQMTNNYDLDVYNGDVGRIHSRDEEQGVRVQFGKRRVVYGYDSLDELEPAYAITIHKSQGSEYPAVVIILHTSHFIMLKRNLLYTAVTRGKRMVVIVGNKRALFRAIKTSTESERMTALKQWLVKPPQKNELFD